MRLEPLCTGEETGERRRRMGRVRHGGKKIVKTIEGREIGELESN